MKTSQLRLLRALLAAPALFVLPSVLKADTATTVRSGVAEANADSKEAALDYLNQHIDQLEDAADNAPDAEKAALKARIDALKERRSELRKNYTKARYEELKADVANEWDKAKSWSKDTFNKAGDSAHSAKNSMTNAAHDARTSANRVGDNMRADAKNVASQAQAAVNPSANAVVSELAVYQLNPSEENKEDVKRALDALDEELDRREDAIDDMPKGPARDSEEAFVKDLRRRESDLRKSFVKARWDALVGDMKARWHRLTN